MNTVLSSSGLRNADGTVEVMLAAVSLPTGSDFRVIWVQTPLTPASDPLPKILDCTGNLHTARAALAHLRTSRAALAASGHQSIPLRRTQLAQPNAMQPDRLSRALRVMREYDPSQAPALRPQITVTARRTAFC